MSVLSKHRCRYWRMSGRHQILITRCLSMVNLPIFNQNCNAIYALYASAHQEWNAALITTTFQLEWICYITPYHLSSCAYIKPHPIGWALRWNIMQMPNNKCTWLNSLRQQPEPCTHTARIFRVSVWTRTLMRTIMLHLLTMSVSVQTSSIKNVKLPKAHSNGAELLCFSHRLEKRQIINLFRSSTSGCLSRVKLLFLVWKH